MNVLQMGVVLLNWESLILRDYLITHPDVAQDYEQLKRRLAAAQQRRQPGRERIEAW